MKKVCVLMSTYNGERYLKKQIESILNQEDVEIHLIVRDDGSTDKTIEILNSYSRQKKLSYYKGNNLGPARSFMDLLNSDYVKEKMDKNTFIAFSDQDDIWNNKKLKRATNVLSESDYKNVPAIYACNFQLIDKNDAKITNINHVVTTDFLSSVIFSSCTGCTMVINYLLYKELVGITPDNIYMHDDWIHKVCLAIGGKVFFDNNQKNVYYRQHEDNVIGLKSSLFSKIDSYIEYLKNPKYKDRMLNEYINIKKFYSNKISKENLELVDKIINYKSMSLVPRIIFINEICRKAEIKGFTKDFRVAMFFKRY